MVNDFERRDHYETFPTRRSAAEYAQNKDLPQWLRNAWAAVSRGEYRNIEAAIDGLETRKQVRSQARKQVRSQRPAKSDPSAARQRALTSKMLDPIDLDIQAKRRELMKREHDPFWWD